jgi:hypothetical protein
LCLYAAESNSPMTVSIARNVAILAMLFVFTDVGGRGLGLPAGSLAALLCVPISLTTLARLLFAHIVLWRTLSLLGLFFCRLWINHVSGDPLSETRLGLVGALIMGFAFLPFLSALSVRNRFGPSQLLPMSRVRVVVLLLVALALVLVVELNTPPTSLVPRSPSSSALVLIQGSIAVIVAANLWEILTLPPLRYGSTRAQSATYRRSVWSWASTH